MNTFPIRTMVSPARYVQGRNAISRLGEFLAPLGSIPLLVADDNVWALVGEDVTASLNAADLPVHRETVAGYATAAQVDRLVQAIGTLGADVVVGVGGGSTIDAAKSAGHRAEIRWASVPTLASTDAPCSALSIIYSEAGAFEEYRFLPRNPDLVLVDSQLVANAPVKFLIAGVGDALATWPEARAVEKAYSKTMAGGLPTLSGTSLAKLSWDVLHENALPAIAAVRDHLVTPAVEKVIEANTLLYGLGFESGGLAAAHAIHDGLTAVSQTHGLTHGQKVNIGTITQLVLEGAASEEIRDFIEFTTRVGLPTSLTEIGLTTGDVADLVTIATAATAEGETIHAMPFEVLVTDLVDALRSIEGLSRYVRADAGLPEPVFYQAH